jgi:nitrite reductase/ring-hydroxylating ferredoxin subunit
MFKNTPLFLSHISAVETGNFASPNYLINKQDSQINLFNRFCPHRSYPLANTGDIIRDSIVCKFHGLEWTRHGDPVNNDRNIKCGKADVGRSGLILKNFTEPDHFWVDDLAQELNLEYSHSQHGTSKGSWLWMMEIQADLLHIRQGENVVHPELSATTNLDEIDMHEGDGWILQTCSTGWWLFVYPYTFVEWCPGCVALNYTTPHDKNKEFGFDWITQYYFDKSTSTDRRKEFEQYVEPVFHEDVATIESQRGAYYPLKKSSNRLEDHCVHFGKWVESNLNKQ